MQITGIKEIEKVLKSFPSITYDGDRRVFYGHLNIDENDSYNIEVHLPTMANKFPKVYELNERIPIKADRHTNKDGSLCFTTNTKEQLLAKTIIVTISDFFEKILIPYLQNNSYYEINGKYLFGEYDHDINIATLETYIDLLKIDDPNLILQIIVQRIKHKKKYRPNDYCYCGSKLKIPKCQSHEKSYKQFSKLSKKVLMRDFTLISKLLNN